MDVRTITFISKNKPQRGDMCIEEMLFTSKNKPQRGDMCIRENRYVLSAGINTYNFLDSSLNYTVETLKGEKL